MITGQVSKIMSKALLRFSVKYGVEASETAIFIRIKSEDFEPLYFKTIKGKVITDENGATKNLSFNKDILAVKFGVDLMGREFLTSNFMKSYFKNMAESEGLDAKNLYLKIGCKDKEAKVLDIILYNNSKPLKRLTLEEVFGE